MRQGKPSHMTEERADDLTRVGFCWDTHEATWLERLQELTLFKEEHGHCNVPTSYTPNPRLGTWYVAWMACGVCLSPYSHRSFRSICTYVGYITRDANTKSSKTTSTVTSRTTVSRPLKFSVLTGIHEIVTRQMMTRQKAKTSTTVMRPRNRSQSAKRALERSSAARSRVGDFLSWFIYD